MARGGLRRRLTVTLVLVAGVSSGILALGTYLLVRQARLQGSLDAAAEQARFSLVLAGGTDFQGGVDPATFVTGYEQFDFHAVLVVGGERYLSDPTVDPVVPADVRLLVADGQLASQRLEIGGEPHLLVGGRPPNSDAELYLLFSEDRLHRDLGQLRNALVAGWVVVVIIAGLAGQALARRTLEPVARASEAAKSMARGQLATRLPVDADDEFGTWAASFNEMAEALGTKITALSEAQARERRFTSDVAHELRTPLAALVGEASLLREHLDGMPPEARRPAELLTQDVARLRRLVDELMEISRFDAGRESVRAETVDLRALVEATVRSRGWDARVGVSGEGLVVPSDRRRLERIVANLVGNAVEHGGNEVRVRIGREAEAAVIEVLDSGPGISPEHLSRLFDRFYKADPARTGAGSGLGLAIARENARLLGGDIDVWSEPGIGSRFTLRIPVTEALHAGEQSVSFGVEDGGDSPSTGGRT
jgi:signal transduction histidine kinase